ncbi:hypothetical protein K450DRAFT_257148 [Umbelopsis ramanniana AG]|uniref:Uncharacterized protein n=1 Tax=Umbelopsis ramanniana AG TaxID=1314678 RepID=A0AAD5E4A9_UMBRA|nr:uncharacterized protein K450DRAFT_257148 [Umbelopsis ramanniana AG]KAI8576409.1 hypothetical protein K450DRAFT_257148 [Umbelopsis ramanniana AG]
MKRPREGAKENQNVKRQATLSSFVIKPKLPTYFHLDHSSKDNTFKATFADVHQSLNATQGFETKIYWQANDTQITLTTNIRNGTFEDQDTWQQKCERLSSSIAADEKKHFEKLETMFLEAVDRNDSSTTLSAAAAMACFERDWSGSPVNGLRRLLHIISTLDIDEEDQTRYAVLVWLQCAETKGFMTTSDCIDYLLFYVEKVSHRKAVNNGAILISDAAPKRQPKPTLDRILLLKDKGMGIRDFLLAMYIRSEFLSGRQGDRIAMQSMVARWYSTVVSIKSPK